MSVAEAKLLSRMKFRELISFQIERAGRIVGAELVCHQNKGLKPFSLVKPNRVHAPNSVLQYWHIRPGSHRPISIVYNQVIRAAFSYVGLDNYLIQVFDMVCNDFILKQYFHLLVVVLPRNRFLVFADPEFVYHLI